MGTALGRLGITAIVVEGQAPEGELHALRIDKDGNASIIPAQEYNGDHVQQAVQESGKSVLRLPVFPRTMVHADLTGSESLPMGQGRYIPVQFSVDVDGFYDASPVYLQSAVKVVNPQSGEQGRHAIPDSGRNAFGQRIFAPFFPA